MAYEREHTCNCGATFIARSPRRLYCDPCRVAASQENEKRHYAKNGRERRAAYVAKNAERVLHQSRERYQRNKNDPRYQRMRHNWRLRTRYGVTIEEYEALGRAHDWRCAICGRTAEEAHTDGRPLHIDHDHQLAARGFGKDAVRGLLCFGCNAAVGQLLEDPVLVQRLADYVNRAIQRRAELG